MRNAKHRRPSFSERHEPELIVLVVVLTGILIGIAPWICLP